MYTFLWFDSYGFSGWFCHTVPYIMNNNTGKLKKKKLLFGKQKDELYLYIS
jgi:hypothetical protein